MSKANKCGCRMMTAEECLLERGHFSPKDQDYGIKYCAVHAAAPAMLHLLSFIRRHQLRGEIHVTAVRRLNEVEKTLFPLLVESYVPPTLCPQCKCERMPGFNPEEPYCPNCGTRPPWKSVATRQIKSLQHAREFLGAHQIKWDRILVLSPRERTGLFGNVIVDNAVPGNYYFMDGAADTAYWAADTETLMVHETLRPWGEESLARHTVFQSNPTT